MADIVIDNRLTAVEADVKEVSGRVDDVEELSTAHSDRIYALEYWRNGNGAKGAEARLQEVEKGYVVLKECLGADKSDEAIERIAAATARSIVKGARERDRTVVEKVKAVSALLSPILAALAVVLAAVLSAT